MSHNNLDDVTFVYNNKPLSMQACIVCMQTCILGATECAGLYTWSSPKPG